MAPAPLVMMDETDIREATDDLSASNMLGTGGFGTVYRFRRREGSDVAVKVFSRSGCSDDEWSDRTMTGHRELEVSNAVSDPHVLRVIGMTRPECGIFAIMYDRVATGSLATFLDSKGSPSAAESVSIALCVARGMWAIHAAGIAHADIKSHNVLMMGPGSAIIGDLGTAEFLPPSGIVKMDHCESDYPYWSPEYRSSGRLSTSSDVYCFGIMLAELTVGRTMYHDASLFRDPIQALVRDGRDTFRRNAAWDRATRDIIVHLAAKCLLPHARDRLDAAACIAALDTHTDVCTPTPSAKRKRVE